MPRRNYKPAAIILALSMTLVTSGCDKISEFAGYFSKTDDLASTPAKPDSKPAKKAVPKKKKAELGPLPADVVVRIGGWSITKEDFDERFANVKEAFPELDVSDQEVKEMLLEELVNQQAIVLDAEKTGLAKNKEIVSAISELRKTLIVREVAVSVTENVKTTEQEAREFYEARKDMMISQPLWQVREVVLASQLRANEVLVEVLKGGDFAEIAKASSIGNSASQGGALGFIEDVPFVEMATPLLALEEGEVSSVFEGPEGYYIIKLEAKKGGEPIPFDEIKQDIIENQTMVKQQQALVEHVEKVKSNLKIEKNESLLK